MSTLEKQCRHRALDTIQHTDEENVVFLRLPSVLILSRVFGLLIMDYRIRLVLCR